METWSEIRFGVFGLLYLFFLLQVFSTLPSLAEKKVTVQGDILLGGIFPIHQKGKGKCINSNIHPT